jgi:hypothetical protein
VKKRKNSSKRSLLILSFILLLIAAEAVFGILEIVVGRFLLMTNSVRPQIGRLWDEDHKEQLGIDELEANSNKTEELPAVVDIHSFQDLKLILSTRSSLSMSRDEFKKFYTDLPMMQAKGILDPLYFIELDRNPDWQRTQLSLVGDQLVIYFIDGYERPIKESHVSVLDTLINIQIEDVNAQLDELDEFEGRIIPAAVFFHGFDRLPRTYRLQIVNDPYNLVQWGNNLQRVAISPFVTDDGVEILFEIKRENGSFLEKMFASEIAVNYLIDELNTIDQTLYLEMPSKKDEND